MQINVTCQLLFLQKFENLKQIKAKCGAKLGTDYVSTVERHHSGHGW